MSPGCANCYAEVNYSVKVRGVKWGPNGNRIVKAESGWKEPISWNRLAGRSVICDAETPNGRVLNRPRVFCASLADVFENWQGRIHAANGKEMWKDKQNGCWEEAEEEKDYAYYHEPLTMDDVRARLFKLIDATPNLDWLLLTKRPENIRSMWPKNGIGPNVSTHSSGFVIRSNAWLGVSVEDQKQADKRIPLLLQTPAAVRFLSMEPLLGPIDLLTSVRGPCPNCEHDLNDHDSKSRIVGCQAGDGSDANPICGCRTVLRDLLHWAIVGGESGPDARPCDIEWVRRIAHQCKKATVPCFVKQLGSRPMHDHTTGFPHATLDVTKPPTHGDGFGNYTVELRDKKGGDMSEWPDDLRVRQWPARPQLGNI